jgi:hypothetical protein
LFCLPGTSIWYCLPILFSADCSVRIFWVDCHALSLLRRAPLIFRRGFVFPTPALCMCHSLFLYESRHFGVDWVFPTPALCMCHSLFLYESRHFGVD